VHREMSRLAHKVFETLRSRELNVRDRDSVRAIKTLSEDEKSGRNKDQAASVDEK